MAKILTTDNLSTIWSKINSTFAKKTEITSVFKYKGTIGTGGTKTTLPTTYAVGDVWYVKTAGPYAGQTCEVGDMLICITAQSSGTSVNNAHWTVVQNNWSVEAKNPKLSWGTEHTLANVGGVDIKVTMPAAPTSVANATNATTASKLGTATKGSTTKPIYLNAGTPTECTTYAGGTAVTLNGANKAGSTASFYAPTTAGSNGQILKNNNGTPTWTTPDYVTSSNADATYLKKTDAASTYLTKSVATSTYLTKSDAATTYLKPGGIADKLHVENLPEVDMVSPTGGGDNEYSYLRGNGTPLLNNLCYLDLAIENIVQTYLLEDQFAEKLNELLGGELEGYFATTDEINNILK